MEFVVIGVDIGQKRDPTAICVVESEKRPGENGRQVWHHTARHLERLPLGTPYPEVAKRIAEVAHNAIAHTKEKPWVYVDATGVGQPIVDLLREHYNRVIAAYFTHGDQKTFVDYGVKLGKAWLVSRLQALLQTGRIHLPRTSEAKVLAEELLDYEIRVDENANDKYGAFRVGTHDDLVTALGLAVQRSPLPHWD